MQSVEAMTTVNRPSLTTHFTRNVFAALLNSLSNFRCQVKIPTNALTVGTLEAKHRPGVVEVDHILKLGSSLTILCVVVFQFYSKGL